LGPLRAGMAAVLRAGLQAGTVEQCLTETLCTEEHCTNPVPSLERRLNNIGFGTARMEPLVSETAAKAYLP
jgi:hypothetical protein